MTAELCAGARRLAVVGLLLPLVHCACAQQPVSAGQGQAAAVNTAPAYDGSKEYSLPIQVTKLTRTDGTGTWTPSETRGTRVMEQLAGFHAANTPMDKWGGRIDRSAQATGFFYVKQIDGRWWAVDPDGHLYIHRAVVELAPSPSPKAKAALAKLYGTEDDWIAKTQGYLVYNGFNGAGAWSDVKLIRSSSVQAKHPLAYTVNLDVMSSYGKQRGGLHAVPGHAGYPHDVIFAFDPGFEAFADEYLKKVAEYADDPALFGYFSDNEMPIRRSNLDNYLELPHDDAGYKAAKQWMQDNHVEHVDDNARKRFLAFEVEHYASVVTAALRKYDPHHMYLGCRYTGETENAPEAFAALGKYADAISVNYYNSWTPDYTMMAAWAASAKKPILITEWYVKGSDSGLPNKTGAGWLVRTQAERGDFYQNFTLALLQSKVVIGWHWFKFQDNDPTDPHAELSNRDANKGIVNITYQAYQGLMDRMRQLNPNVYALADYFDTRTEPKK